MSTPVWTREAAKRYLNDFPLPTDFRWPHTDGGERSVWPVHSVLTGGYGKWLSETPNFKGLFELIVEILNDQAVLSDPGDGIWMAAQLRILRDKHEAKLEPSTAPLAHRLRPFVSYVSQPTFDLK